MIAIQRIQISVRSRTRPDTIAEFPGACCSGADNCISSLTSDCAMQCLESPPEGQTSMLRVPAVKVENLAKRFGSLAAHDGQPFELGRGRCCVLLGGTAPGQPH